jgi:hypothetical protein
MNRKYSDVAILKIDKLVALFLLVPVLIALLMVLTVTDTFLIMELALWVKFYSCRAEAWQAICPRR